MATIENMFMLYVNIRSMRNKLGDLNDMILANEKTIHIIVLTETWIYPNEQDFFKLHSYTSVHDCRNTKGGGCSIYIKDGINYVLNDKYSVSLMDCNIVSVFLPGLNFAIFVIYRPPKNKCNEFLLEIDKLLEQQKRPCIVIGDINIDLLKDSTTINEYKNIVLMNGFQFQNKVNLQSATRTTKNTASILDHVITNKNIKCNISLEEHTISDHKIIYTEITKVVHKTIKQSMTRSYLDINKWKQRVEEEMEKNEINCFGLLAQMLNRTKKECTKENSIKIRNNNFWVTHEYITKLKNRDKLYVRWKRIPNEYTENEFKKEKNELNKLRTKLQKQYAERKFQQVQGDIKKTWSILNDLCSRSNRKSNNISKLTIQNGETCSDDTEIAAQMNRHFSSIGQTLASKIIQNQALHFDEEEEVQSITLQTTNLREIKSIISDLKNSCSPGIDNITKNDIQTHLDIIGTKIVQIINEVLETGQYPEELKIAKIVPIYKKGSHDDVNNYRPISLLSTFGKILEKVIKSRLIGFIDANFKIDKNQFGFQKQSGTLGATVELLEHITSELDKNRYVVCVFIDLQKAFDTVDITLLLKKFDKMGFRGKCHDLLQTYSTERKQCTYVNGKVSAEANISVGVAQGSVLGPLEYLLYVQSLKYAGLKAKYIKFCDDTVLVYSGTVEEELEADINADLKKYFEWLCHNRLTINVEKTVYMVISQTGKRPIQPKVKLNDKELKKVQQYKYLGLIITEKLAWSAHIQSITEKVIPILGAIRRCSHMLNKNTKYLLYNSFIEPHIRYLLPCYGNASEHLINKLQRLQNKSIKAIFSINYWTASETLYIVYPFLKVKQLKMFEQAKLIFKINNKLLKTNVQLRQNMDFYNYDLRTRDNLRNTYQRTKKSQDSPIFRSVQTYNGLPRTLFEGEEKAVCRNLKIYFRNRD